MSILEIAMVVLILADLLMLGASRLNAGIRIVALQGILLGLFAFVAQIDHFTFRIAAIALVSIAVKGFVFPFLLQRAIREADIRREDRPLIGYNLSLAAGMAGLGAAFWLNGRLPLGEMLHLPLVLPASLMTMFTGLFIIVSRRSALAQSLGYIVLENGIFAFGIAAVGEIPMLVELGILLDAFVAVLVMGIAIYHINREFDHMDVVQLSSLKG